MDEVRVHGASSHAIKIAADRLTCWTTNILRLRRPRFCLNYSAS